MKIVNETNCSYSVIGKCIDTIMKYSEGTTHYVGQVEHTTVEILDEKFNNTRTLNIQIRYLKRYVEWVFYD